MDSSLKSWFIGASIRTTVLVGALNHNRANITANTTVAKRFNQLDIPARTLTVTLDISKSFDTIKIHTLIRKLLLPKIPCTIIKFIANYIKERKAYTCRNHTSSQRTFKTGVPQGGVLLPTLFNIYTSASITVQVMDKTKQSHTKSR